MFTTNILSKFTKSVPAIAIVALSVFSFYQYERISTLNSLYKESISDLTIHKEALSSLKDSYDLLQNTYKRQSELLREYKEDRDVVKELVNEKILEMKDKANENGDGSISNNDFNRLYNELCYKLFPERCLHPVLPSDDE